MTRTSPRPQPGRCRESRRVAHSARQQTGIRRVCAPRVRVSPGLRRRAMTPVPSSAGLRALSTTSGGSIVSSARPAGSSGAAPAATAHRPISASRAAPALPPAPPPAKSAKLGLERSEALRTGSGDDRAGGLWTRREVHAREPADGTHQRDGDDAVGRDLGLGQARRCDGQAVGADEALLHKRRRRGMHPVRGVTGPCVAPGDVERRRRLELLNPATGWEE